MNSTVQIDHNLTTDNHPAGNLGDLEVLHSIFVAKEGRLLGQLGQAMADKSADTFDTWMKQQSDLVQATAHAYADREVLEASLRSLGQVHPMPEMQHVAIFWGMRLLGD